MKVAAQPADPVLPRLRTELVIRPDERTPDGEPTWTIHDPVNNKFVQVDWATFEILQRWAFGRAKAIAEAVCAETTLQVDDADVGEVARFLSGQGFLDLRGADFSGALAKQQAARRPGFWKWLLANYLSIRIRLFNPDRLLGWLAPRVGFLYSRTFLYATLAAALLGVLLVARQWELFRTTLASHFTFSGASTFLFVLFGAKILHEFGHAVTAKRMGVRVTSMGVALIVLLPMLFSDVNDVWRVGDRRKRLAVSIAGVATEVMLAAWATLAWGLLPDGYLRNAAFFLGFVGWVGTVLINMSPFMRFDGYFVLSDWAGIPNLHDEAGALGRWKMRQLLLGLRDPMPAVAAPSQARWLIAFAWFTWMYRISVFVGIAAVVYHFAIKLVGIILFFVEIIWFIVVPVYQELRAWSERADTVRRSPVFLRTLMIFGTGLVLACVPWPSLYHGAAVLRTAEERILYAPEAAQVTVLPARDGAAVTAGRRLAELSSAKLEQRVLENEARLRRLEAEAAAARVSPFLSDRLPVVLGQLETVLAIRDALRDDVARLTPAAPAEGEVRFVDPELAVGDWVAKDEALLVVRQPAPWRATVYVEEGAIHRIFKGASARFYPTELSGRTLAMRVERIDRDTSQILSLPMLAQSAGGSVESRPDGRGNEVPVHSVYRVTLVADEGVEAWAGRDWRGRVIIRGESDIPIVRLFRYVMSIVWREAGF